MRGWAKENMPKPINLQKFIRVGGNNESKVALETYFGHSPSRHNYATPEDFVEIAICDLVVTTSCVGNEVRLQVHKVDKRSGDGKELLDESFDINVRGRTETYDANSFEIPDLRKHSEENKEGKDFQESFNAVIISTGKISKNE